MLYMLPAYLLKVEDFYSEQNESDKKDIKKNGKPLKQPICFDCPFIESPLKEEKDKEDIKDKGEREGNVENEQMQPRTDFKNKEKKLSQMKKFAPTTCRKRNKK